MSIRRQLSHLAVHAFFLYPLWCQYWLGLGTALKWWRDLEQHHSLQSKQGLLFLTLEQETGGGSVMFSCFECEEFSSPWWFELSRAQSMWTLAVAFFNIRGPFRWDFQCMGFSCYIADSELNVASCTSGVWGDLFCSVALSLVSVWQHLPGSATTVQFVAQGIHRLIKRTGLYSSVEEILGHVLDCLWFWNNLFRRHTLHTLF